MTANDQQLALVRGVHHVSFTVDDLDEALAFYCDLLGCRPIQRPALGFSGAWLLAGATEVHLLAVDRTPDMGTPPTNANPGANHVAFQVPDLDAAVETLTAAGLEIRWGTTLPQVFVQDPSGNVIEFTAAGT